MRAISLWQPYASLMASGAKRIETRDWQPRGLRVGELVAIHAAKRWTADEIETCYETVFYDCLALAQDRGLWSFEAPPLGCVVAIARFYAVVPTFTYPAIRQQYDNAIDWERMSDEEGAFGNYGPDRYGWVFDAVRPITPIALRGQRNLFGWTPPSDLTFLEPRNEAKSLPLVKVAQANTRVVHCKHEYFDVYIGRAMPRYPELRSVGWGNPYKDGLDTAQGRQSAIDRFREWLLTQPRLLARLPELRGKRLGCWCAPSGGLKGDLHGRTCHGEVLAYLADHPEEVKAA